MPFPDTLQYKPKFVKLQMDYEMLQSRISVLETKEALMMEYLGIAKSKLRVVFYTFDDLVKLLCFKWRKII